MGHRLMLLFLPALVVFAADVKALNSGDIATLASRAAEAFAACKPPRGTTVVLSDLSNRTDEHIDKAVVTRALAAALRKKLGVGLVGVGDTGAGAGAPALTAALMAEKTESGAAYSAVYRLELTVLNGEAQSCRVQARLEKKSRTTR